jgi:hypothetical protein
MLNEFDQYLMNVIWGRKLEKTDATETVALQINVLLLQKKTGNGSLLFLIVVMLMIS